MAAIPLAKKKPAAKAPAKKIALAVKKAVTKRVSKKVVPISTFISPLVDNPMGHVADPARLDPEWKFAPRTPFLQKIQGCYHLDGSGVVTPEGGLPVRIDQLPTKLRADYKVTTAFSSYERLYDTQARLPKFTRWVNSVYPDFKELHQALALLMQGNVKESVYIDVSPMALYNYSNTDHFWSCLNTTDGRGNKSGSFRREVRKVFEENPGIGVAYILNQETGKMKGRIFLHHYHSDKYGDGLRIANNYGCLSQLTLINALKANKLNFPIFTLGYGGYGGKEGDDVWNPVEMNLRPEPADHWDTYPLNCPIKVAANNYMVKPNAG